MTIRDNSLRSDAVRFGLQLAPELLGAVACRLVRATVDPKVGPEVLLVFTEEPAFAGRYGGIADLKLVTSAATVPTPYGVVGAIVWRIAAGTPAEVYIEQFIDPSDAGAVALVREASQQTRLRLAVLDNKSSELRSVSDFANIFQLDGLVKALDAAKAEAKPETIDEAIQYAKLNAKLIDKVRAQG